MLRIISVPVQSFSAFEAGVRESFVEPEHLTRDLRLHLRAIAMVWDGVMVQLKLTRSSASKKCFSSTQEAVCEHVTALMLIGWWEASKALC